MRKSGEREQVAFGTLLRALGFQGTSPSGACILQHDQLRKLAGEKPNSFYWKVEL